MFLNSFFCEIKDECILYIVVSKFEFYFIIYGVDLFFFIIGVNVVFLSVFNKYI